jgi:hypothetical protein
VLVPPALPVKVTVIPFRLNELEPTEAAVEWNPLNDKTAEAVVNPILLGIPKVPEVSAKNEVAEVNDPEATLDTNNVSPPCWK